jgi:hypothetical protein
MSRLCAVSSWFDWSIGCLVTPVNGAIGTDAMYTSPLHHVVGC